MTKHVNQPAGFTLLEIMIVIIIAGVLVGMAIPRYFATIEYAKSTEALNSMAVLRKAMDRCYMQRSGTYAGCSMANLDVENPTNMPNSHFTYSVSGTSVTGYTLTATRNTYDGGFAGHVIQVHQTATRVTRSGTGAFAGLQ